MSRRLQFLGAVRAVNVSIVSYKALVCQVERALLTVKAVIVPRAALIVHYVRSLAKSCNGILAAAALFGHSAFVAVHTVDLFLVGGEAGASQRLSAGGAHKTL